MTSYTIMIVIAAALFSGGSGGVSAFAPCINNLILQQQKQHHNPTSSSTTCLSMALDDSMKTRLDGIRRSYQALTERLADPDVIGNSNLLRQVMKDRSKSEEVVLVYEDYCGLDTELEGAQELFQEAGDDVEMREMARSEIKEIEDQLDELETNIKVLLLPKDPNDERNCMLEIRAGTGGSEANIFAGTCSCSMQLYILALFSIDSACFTNGIILSCIIYILNQQQKKGIYMMSIVNSCKPRDGKFQ